MFCPWCSNAIIKSCYKIFLTDGSEMQELCIVCPDHAQKISQKFRIFETWLKRQWTYQFQAP